MDDLKDIDWTDKNVASSCNHYQVQCTLKRKAEMKVEDATGGTTGQQTGQSPTEGSGKKRRRGGWGIGRPDREMAMGGHRAQHGRVECFEAAHDDEGQSETKDAESRRAKKICLLLASIGKLKDQTPNDIILAQERISMPTSKRNLYSRDILQSSSAHLRKKSWICKKLWQVHDQVDQEPGVMTSNFEDETESDIMEQSNALCPDFTDELRYAQNVSCTALSPCNFPSVEHPCLGEQRYPLPKKIMSSNNTWTWKTNHSLQDAYFTTLEVSESSSEELSTTRDDKANVNFSSILTNGSSPSNETFLEWDNAPMCKDLESRQADCRFSEDEIEIMPITFSAEEHTLTSESYHNRVDQNEILGNTENIAATLDWSLSSTSDPHVMMYFGRPDGCDSWSDCSDESFSSSIVKRSQQALRNLQSGSPILRSFREKRNCSINNIFGQRFEINNYGTISTDTQNPHQQELSQMQDRMILEQFKICNSMAKSKEFQTNSYLEELSMLQEKSDAMPCTSSIVESNSKSGTETTADSLHAKCRGDWRAPEVRLNSLDNIFDVTFGPNSAAPLQAVDKNPKELQLDKGHESISSPNPYFHEKEQRKSLIIPEMAHLNNFTNKQISRKKLDRIMNSLHNHEKAEGSLKYNEKAEGSPKQYTGVDFESSSMPACNQEDVQFNLTEPQRNKDEVQQKESFLNSFERRQDLHACSEYEGLLLCCGKPLNSKPETGTDSERQGHSKPNQIAKSSLMEGTDAYREKIEPQRDSPVVPVINSAHSEYQGMLESYILQLRCMNNALQGTLDWELHKEKCQINDKES